MPDPTQSRLIQQRKQLSPTNMEVAVTFDCYRDLRQIFDPPGLPPCHSSWNSAAKLKDNRA